MAIVVDIISEFSDKGLRSAKGAFDDFKTRVGKAEGAMGKFQAGTTAVFDIVKANAGTFALGAGAAFAGFAAQGIKAFQDVALEAGKFSDATGLTVDQASRWREVAGDIGTDSGVIDTSIGRMNKLLENSPDLFKDLGVQIEYSAGGAVDVNSTFLNVIDRLKEIKDPAERASVASQLLGKGWQGMAELIAQGSDKLRSSLDQVSGSKVIDEKELQRARDFRDTMDKLRDIGEDFAIALGENLVPVIETTVSVGSDVGDIFSSITDTLNQLTDDLYLTNNATEDWIDNAVVEFQALKDNADARKGYNDALIDAYGPTNDLTWSEEQLTEQTWHLTDAWENLLGTLDLNKSFRDAEDAIRKADEAAKNAFADPSKFNDYKDAQDQVIKKFATILEDIQATDEEQNRIKFLVDTAPLDYALEAIKKLDLVKTGQISSNLTRFDGARAMGGTVSAGGTYLVGERGPELLSIGGQGGRITPNSAIGGGGITVNVNGGDPNAIVRALQQYVRQSGPVPVNTRAM